MVFHSLGLTVPCSQVRAWKYIHWVRSKAWGRCSSCGAWSGRRSYRSLYWWALIELGDAHSLHSQWSRYWVGVATTNLVPSPLNLWAYLWSLQMACYSASPGWFSKGLLLYFFRRCIMYEVLKRQVLKWGRVGGCGRDWRCTVHISQNSSSW